MPYYRVDYRQQDESWQHDTQVPTTDHMAFALRKAEKLSRDPLYGMARVVQVDANHVITEFSAGHHPWSEEARDVAFCDAAVKDVERLLAAPPQLNVMNIGTAQDVHIQQGNMPRWFAPDSNPTLCPQAPDTTKRNLRGVRVRPRPAEENS